MSGLLIPSYGQGFASSAGESDNPGLWDGLGASWPFLGPTGTVLFDESGGHFDGTLSNMDPSSDWVIGQNGWELDFNDSQTVDIQQVLTGLPYTLAAWGVLDTVNAETFVGNRAVSVYRTEQGNSYSGLGVTQNTKAGAFTRDGATAKEIEGSTITLGEPVLLVFTDSPGENQLYLNGRLDASAAWTNTESPGAGDIQLASGRRSLNNRQWDGRLSFAGIWFRALSAAEIQLLFEDPFALHRLRRRVYPAAVAGPPTYNGSAAITLASLSVTGSGTYTPLYEATATLTLGSLSITAAGTYAPLYQGSGTLTVGSLIVAAAGALSYQGTGSLTVGALLVTGAATYTPLYQATGTLTVAALSVTGAGEYTSVNIEGSGTLTVAALTVSGAGTYTSPAYEGSGALTVGQVAVEGSADYSTADYAGNGQLTLAALSVVGTATYAPLYQGSGDVTVAS
ncbi:MAG TPA: hypothetical protein ENH78_16595, partial [Phycisphaerae bacterium]|nr:hypothetical protein [Phycisphaerae bacterium]